MKRGGPLKRKKPLRRVNPERRERRRKAAFGAQAALCRTLPCVSCGAAPPSDPAHVRSRGAGGLDWANVIPLCREDHQLQGSVGWEAVAVGRGSESADAGLAWAEGVAQGLALVAYGRPA